MVRRLRKSSIYAFYGFDLYVNFYPLCLATVVADSISDSYITPVASSLTYIVTRGGSKGGRGGHGPQ